MLPPQTVTPLILLRSASLRETGRRERRIYFLSSASPRQTVERGILTAAFLVHSFRGFMNGLPFLLLGSLCVRIRFKRVMARLALQFSVAHPPIRGNAAVVK